MNRLKSQSAMEYLMTYGWAILIVAVVLGALFELGIFSGTTFGGNACIPASGYLCNNPVLSTNGLLSVSFGEVGYQITITGVSCSTNSTAPSSFYTTDLQLYSGQTATLDFHCPIASTTAGSPFSGDLFIEYNEINYPTQVVRFAAISTKASLIGQTTIPVILSVPITITNAQGVPTPAPFQQMISFDPSSYSSYESADLGNIRFFSGVNELHSWCESGCTNSSSSAIFWVNLPAGVPASSNTALSMGFESVGTNYDGVFAGEAPQLSPTYGEYDNGASVFSFYDNFAGTHISVAWDTAGGAYSVDNGLIITPANLAGESFSLNSKYTAPLVIDTLQYFTTTGSPDYLGISFTNMTSTTYDYSSGYYTQIEGGEQLLCSTGGAPATCGSPSDTANPNQYTEQVTTLEVNGAKSAAALQNYGNMVVNNNPTSSASEYPGYMGYATTGQTILSYWFRIRAYPPNGVMPTVTLG